MGNQVLDLYQKNLIDLKIEQAKKEFELNFSILSFENLEKMESLDIKYKNSAFLQAYFILSNNELFEFVQKVNSDNIEKLSYGSNDKKVLNFLKNIKNLISLDEKKLQTEEIKLKEDIKKLDEAIAELDGMMLGSLPKSHYSS